MWDLNSLQNMWQWDEKFNVKYDLANPKLVHTRVLGDIFCTIKTQKVFYIKNQTDQCKFWWAHLSGIYITYTMASQDLLDIWCIY